MTISKLSVFVKLGLVAAAMVAGTAAQASETWQDQLYVNSQVGLTNYDLGNLDTGLVWTAAAGVQLDETVLPNLSLETEFATTLLAPSEEFNTGFGKVETEVSYFSLAGYGKYTHAINEQLSLAGRVGLAYVDVEAEVSGSNGFTSGVASASDSSIELAFGGELGYQLQDVKLIAGITFIGDISNYTLGAQIPFSF